MNINRIKKLQKKWEQDKNIYIEIKKISICIECHIYNENRKKNLIRNCL